MEIIAEKREKLGKRSKSLKADRKIPAVMFGKHLESVPVQIDTVQFSKVFKVAGETSLIDLNIDGKVEKVLVKHVQNDPIKGAFIHVSFYKVNLKEKTTANIPVEIIGEETNALVKSGEGLVLVLLDEIEVEALPTDLPSKFVVDVSSLTELGKGITIADLQYDKSKVEIPGYEMDDVIVKIDEAKMKEEEVAPVEVTEEELVAKVEGTKELTEEEKAEREKKDKEKKEAKEKPSK